MSERQRNRSLVARAAVGALVWAATTVGIVTSAGADGAFPNSQSILLPRDRPNQIVVATTFGLVFSEDDGVTWRYSCENEATVGGRQYIMGPPPDDRIYALSNVGVPVTADGACTWTVGAVAVAALMPVDVFPDPSDPLRVFALADNSDEGLVSAYRSVDAGATYLGPIFKSPLGAVLTGIESARSASQTVYLTLYEGPGVHPILAQSADGGDTWTTTDIEPGIGAAVPYIAAVDPTDPLKIYMRITSGPGDPQIFQGLAITTDAGKTWSIPLKVVNGQLVGFARLPDGNLFLVGNTAPVVPGEPPVPAAFRSDDGGKTFVTQTLPFHPAGLAERDGTLFVAANNFLDGFPLASSSDGGKSWRTRLRFRDIVGTNECVRSTCQADCDYWAGLKLFSPEVCTAPADAAVADATVKPPTSGDGCGCGLGTPSDPRPVFAIGAAILLLGSRVVGRRRARRNRS